MLNTELPELPELTEHEIKARFEAFDTRVDTLLRIAGSIGKRMCLAILHFPEGESLMLVWKTPAGTLVEKEIVRQSHPVPLRENDGYQLTRRILDARILDARIDNTGHDLDIFFETGRYETTRIRVPLPQY